MDPKKFFTELQRREVYPATVIHARTIWRLIQIERRVMLFVNTPNRMAQLMMTQIGRSVRPLESLS